MNKSKILVLLLAMLMIISVSAVSAAEDIDDSSDIISIENDAVDEEIQSSVDSEIIADDGNSGETATVGNFSSLQKIINDDETGTVELNQNYAFDSENDSSLISGIIINKNITLDGKGHTIDAKNSARIFKLNANDITLKNITFVNAKSETTDTASYGGAIYSNGAYKNQVISDCKFSNNTAYNGGAIYLGADDSKITGCEFEDNKASASGGAVFVVGWNATVADSTFNKNNATETGGAVTWFSTKTGVIEGSTFTNNIANQAGGAVSWQKAGGEITDSTFTANEAPNAGAVCWMGNEGTIKGGKFSKNKATGNLGGAIFADANANAKKLTISSTFEENTAVNGGAVALYNNAEIVKSQFTNNTATSQGAALFAQATTNLTESVFEKNNPASNSADIYNAPEGTLNLKNNTFDSESPIKNDGQIQKPGSNVTISPITNVTYGNTVVVYYNIVNRSSNVTASVCLDDGNMQPTVETAVIKIIDNETIAITNLTAGKYLIIVFNNEDNNVYGNSSSAFFTVNKADPNLQVTAKVNAVGIIEIDATVDKNVTGNITFKVINETGAVVLEGEEEIENGAAKFAELTVLPKGKYNYTVSYENENYNTTTINSETPLVVDKEVAHIDIKSAEVNEYGMIVIKANITKDATGSVNFYFYNTDTGKNLTVPIEIGENGTIEYDENTPFEKGYYYVQIGYNGDNKYYETIETSTSEDVNVTKTAPAIDVYVSSIENNVTVKVIADNNTVSGKVNITLFDKDGKAVKNITKDMTNGAIEEVTFTGIEIGDYLVRADFLGSDDFYQTFAVNETKVIASTEMNVTATVNQFGQIVVLANLTKGATGTVLFIITNSSADNIVNLTAEILDGTALDMTTDVLAKGFYNVKAIYSGDDYHANCTAFADVEIAKEVPVIEIINVTVDKIGAIVVNANITKGVSGNVTFLFINTDTGKNLTVPIEIGENGTIEYDELTPFEKGFYTVVITYDGDGKYYGAHEVSYVNVTKTAPAIDVYVSSIENNVTVKVTATNDTVSGKVNITLFDNDGNIVKNITKDMTNGAIEEVTFTGIEIGDYLVRADFLGSDDFYQTFAVNETKVRASTEMNVTTTVNQFGQIVVAANLTKGATGTVLFIITNFSGDNIVNLTAEIDNGTAQDWTTDVLAKGVYSVKAVYSGDDHYATSTKFGDAEIAKEYLNVTSKVSIMDGANQATIVFTFSGNASGNATAFFLNYGTNASYAIQNGTVVIDEIFDSGAQSVLLTYDGDEKYYGFYDVYADFFVKASSFIKVKANPVVYQNNGKVTITLTDNYDGKGINPIANAPVTVTVNGKTYKATTNAKGIATVTIPAKLVPKQYTATVSYAGTNTTVGDKETFKFTVKKATPKLTAKKKTFKSKTKVKKYTIVLKDNKNKAIKKVKVYLKIGKKTYTAKTSSKGKAVFKIKKLTKRGTYKAKVTFKGNKYFNKLTKKATIKVRR